MKQEESAQRWAAVWQSENRLDGRRCHFLRRANREWALFRNRKDARDWVREHYGYIMNRPDLRAEPYGWKYPKVVRVKVNVGTE